MLGPRLRAYRPGECLHLSIPTLGLDTDAIMLTREIDPGRVTMTCTFIGETADKHDYALGLSGTPPPTPALGQTGEERDAIAAVANGLARAAHVLRSQTVNFPVSSTDTTISVDAFDGVLDDGRAVSFPSDTITGLDDDALFAVLWDLMDEEYVAAPWPAATELADSRYVFINKQATSLTGTFPTPTPPPDGYGGGGGWINPIP